MFVSKESSVILKPNNNWIHICQGEVLPEDENTFSYSTSKKVQDCLWSFPCQEHSILRKCTLKVNFPTWSSGLLEGSREENLQSLSHSIQISGMAHQEIVWSPALPALHAGVFCDVRKWDGSTHVEPAMTQSCPQQYLCPATYIESLEYYIKHSLLPLADLSIKTSKQLPLVNFITPLCVLRVYICGGKGIHKTPSEA